MPDSIAAFITARLDEEATAANDADDKALGPWHVDDWYNGELRKDGLTARADVKYLGRAYITGGRGGCSREVADHIVRHDPVHVLADIAAKRRILARHRVPGEGDWQAQSYPRMCLGCGTEGEFWDPRTGDIEDCPELRDLASTFAGHPDFKAKWKIDD